MAVPNIPARPKLLLSYIFGSLVLLGCCKMARDLSCHTKQSVSKKIEKVIENGAVAVFDCKPVEKEWHSWLERAFANTQTHNALLHLLINGIQDKRFLTPVTAYGLDLVETAFRSKAVLNSSAKMIHEVLVKEQRVVNAAVNFCVWYARDPRVIQLTSQLMCNVHLRPDTCSVMSWQVSCGSFDGCQTDEFRSATFWAGLNAVSSPVVAATAKHEMLVRPLANSMSFGLYNKVLGKTTTL